MKRKTRIKKGEQSVKGIEKRERELNGQMKGEKWKRESNRQKKKKEKRKKDSNA